MMDRLRDDVQMDKVVVENNKNKSSHVPTGKVFPREVI